GLRLDAEGFHADALERPLVGTALALELHGQPVLVPIERVGVLHDELAQADQSGARPWLVPLLDRDVVEQLWKQPVAVQLARMERDRLLMRQRQHELRASPVLEPEDLLDEVAAALLPKLGRGE